VGGRER
jgi:hypothetical protein